ncbi:MAG: hypothetical protein K0S51_1722 [Bacillales bacterium]|jgi:hypothetical protein|nr:hypothetical protein [Bacillales bacterium]
MSNFNSVELIEEFIILDNRRKFLIREAITIYKKNKKIDLRQLINPINSIVHEINNISRLIITPYRSIITEEFFNYK